MQLTFSDFFSQVLASPSLMVITVLILAVILVNGWTDAPNAIATAVSTRSIRPKQAIFMAAIFNFLGVFVMMMITGTVAETIRKMVNFGSDQRAALIALSAAMVAIVVWAVAAWMFGIPTSESHALIAGLSGAAIAIHNGSLAGISFEEWRKVLIGLAFTVSGFILGFIVVKIVEFICKDMDRRKTQGFFGGAQIFGSAAMAFMHGAQDGQKFIGVFMLAIYLVNDITVGSAFIPPVWLMLLCSIVMGLGTSIGGEKIIKTVGMEMVELEKYQGFSADISAALCLLVFTLFGIPVSTTHIKTTAMMGVGAAKRASSVNWNVVKELVLAWVLTFPGCGLVGFLMAKLFLRIF